VASRSLYLFLRLCEKNLNYFAESAELIINHCIQLIQKIETGQINEKLLGPNDMLSIFNIIGTFLANKNVAIDYRARVITEVLGHLVQ
jgi:hypothetical protein